MLPLRPTIAAEAKIDEIQAAVDTTKQSTKTINELTTKGLDLTDADSAAQFEARESKLLYEASGGMPI